MPGSGGTTGPVEPVATKRARTAVVTPSAAVLVLSTLIAGLALLTSTLGLFSTGGSAPASVVSVHGEMVALYGSGPYRFESVFKGAGNRGSDAVTLALAVPLLLGSALRYRQGSPAGALMLTSALTWFLYLNATMSLGAAYNELYLVYVALFSASLGALLLVVRSVDARELAVLLGPAAPRRGVAALMLVSGLVTAVVWLAPLLAAAVSGQPPGLLDHGTTMVTDTLDLALITPATLVAAHLLHRGRPGGYLLAAPLLGLLAFLLPMVVAQTVFQTAADLRFSAAEVIGPISGFLALGAIAVRLLGTVVRLSEGSRALEPGHGGKASTARVARPDRDVALVLTRPKPGGAGGWRAKNETRRS